MASAAPDIAPLLNKPAGFAQAARGNRSKKPMVALILALALILIVAGEARRMMTPVKADTVSVVGAAADIPAGCRLSFGNLHYIEIPKRYLTQDMMTSSEQAVGYVTRLFVPIGEPITGAHVFPSKKGMSYSCETHERAITLHLDDDALVDHNLFPDDTVDVIATITRDGKKFTKTICQDIRVLMCATRADLLLARTRSTNNQVTLAATPQQAEYLAEAAETGKVRLLLRNRLATNTHKLPGIGEDDLLPEHLNSMVARLPVLAEVPAPMPQSTQASPPMPDVPLPGFPAAPRSTVASEAPPEACGPLGWVVEMFSGSKRDLVEIGASR